MLSALSSITPHNGARLFSLAAPYPLAFCGVSARIPAFTRSFMSTNTIASANPAFSRSLSTILSTSHPAFARAISQTEPQPEAPFSSIAEAFMDGLTAFLEDHDPGFQQIDYDEGELAVIVPDDVAFTLNLQTHNRELLLSSPISGSTHYKLQTCGGVPVWVDPKSGRGLVDVLQADLSAALNTEYLITVD
ncbi:Frataxin [Carpediemonas membranifera]|uniref:Frataxin n=1 Tax=Carpediemonas membranifera TaxID=201153 RepID=A0A8J6BDM1_9EUKA|nr:Frataxin [Carpediemonas membranifera]|eukprot:KAG9395292.1 Frataxin [Carpediemonas membranifera]